MSKSSLLVLSSNVLRLGLGFGVSLLLAGTMDPREYGVFSLFMGVLLTAAALSDLGVNIPFVRFYVQQNIEEETASEAFARFVYGWRLWLSLVAMAISSVFLITFGDAYFQRSLPGWMLALGALLVLSEGLSAFFVAFLQARRHFGKLSLLVVQPNVLRVVLLAILALTGEITLATAFLVFAGTLFANMIAGKLFTRDIRALWNPFSQIKNYREAISWTRWTVVQTISNVIVSKFDLLALGAYAIGRDVVGSYALALAFGSILIVMQTSEITVLLPHVSGLKTLEAMTTYRRRAWGLTGLLAIASAGAMVFGWWIVSTFYAENYPDAPELFLFIAAAFTVSALVTPWTLLCYALNKPQIPAYQNLLAIAVLGVSSFILVPRFGAHGMGASVLLSRLLSESLAIVMTIWNLHESPLSARQRLHS